ncbi:MAG TPA: hypothetical protein VFH31_00440 [Pyrinomonadaceae bacterium]|nr:hypothetical protein [Pyrinomonadaceae bacterium]
MVLGSVIDDGSFRLNRKLFQTPFTHVTYFMLLEVSSKPCVAERCASVAQPRNLIKKPRTGESAANARLAECVGQSNHHIFSRCDERED